MLLIALNCLLGEVWLKQSILVALTTLRGQFYIAFLFLPSKFQANLIFLSEDLAQEEHLEVPHFRGMPLKTLGLSSLFQNNFLEKKYQTA